MQSDAQFLEPGDNTALVCVDHQQYQKLVVPQLIDMNYKVHLGLFEEDVLLKLQTYSYNVVIIYENFKGATLQTNPILLEMVKHAGTQRRQHFVMVLSQRYPTNEAMCAFVLSVDQILNVSDLANLKPVLRRGVAQHRELYQAYFETCKTVEAAM